MIAPLRPDPAPTVCLLGGESSGKTTLTQSLYQTLTQTHRLRVVLVPEHLRIWCGMQQRAPHAHEQAEIAQKQTRLIEAAQSVPGVQLVIADTSALSVAIYSALYFSDPSLLPSAVIAQRKFASTLLMGLDFPWQADGFFRDGPALRDNADALLRRELQAHRLPFQTIYGTGEQRLRNTLRALTPILTPLLGQAPVATDELRTQGRPGWICDACSDPECEHRLFTGLLKNLPATPEAP